METTLESLLQLIPLMVVILFFVFMIYFYVKISKYLDIKTKYYQYKIEELENKKGN